MTIKSVWVGRWVRFYSNGTLVIGLVEYVTEGFLSKVQLNTTVGGCDADSVLEWREVSK